jgi:hypothetical protein
MSLLLILYYHISYSEIKKNDSNLVKNIKYRISNIQALLINPFKLNNKRSSPDNKLYYITEAGIFSLNMANEMKTRISMMLIM